MNLPTLAATTASALGIAWMLSAGVAPQAAEVGSPLPSLPLSDFGQSKAESLDDYFGQSVLLEFFAYW